VSLLTLPVWLSAGWWDKVISIFPSVLGFTLGVYGILVGASAGGFGEMLAMSKAKSKKEGEEPSVKECILSSDMARLAGTFVHFLLMQFSTILLALICESFYSISAPQWAPFLGSPILVKGLWALCGFISVYSLFLALATIEWVFTVSKAIIGFHQLKEMQKQNDLAEKAKNTEVDQRENN
jgi:hypothetical protein